jgi:hypothetical protein
MLNGDADRRDCFEYHVDRPQAHLIAREAGRPFAPDPCVRSRCIAEIAGWGGGGSCDLPPKRRRAAQGMSESYSDVIPLSAVRRKPAN